MYRLVSRRNEYWSADPGLLFHLCDSSHLTGNLETDSDLHQSEQELLAGDDILFVSLFIHSQSISAMDCASGLVATQSLKLHLQEWVMSVAMVLWTRLDRNHQNTVSYTEWLRGYQVRLPPKAFAIFDKSDL